MVLTTAKNSQAHNNNIKQDVLIHNQPTVHTFVGIFFFFLLFVTFTQTLDNELEPQSKNLS